MARYKPYNLEQDRWVPLSYAAQGERPTESVQVGAQHREDCPRSGRLSRAMDNKTVLEACPLDPTERARGLRPDGSPAQPFASCYRVFLQSR
jgi:hypothetical protein